MKSFKKLNAFMMAVVLILGVLAVPGGNIQTVESASKKITVKKVKSVNSLTGSKTIYLAKGKKATLKTTVTVTPNTSANKKVTYKSSNRKVATVTSKGVITGKKAGTAKITVISKKNKKKKATVTVKVLKGKVTGIKLNKTSQTLTVGDNMKLTARVKVTKGGKKNVVWSSSNKKVAMVTKKGTVKAVGTGKAIITVKAADGTNKKATCKVTVKEKSTTETPAPKNKLDVKILKKIIQKQNALEANVPTNLDDKDHYTWDKTTGRLTGINWYNCELQGSLSLEELPALTELNCMWNNLTSLDVTKNSALTSLRYDDSVTVTGYPR